MDIMDQHEQFKDFYLIMDNAPIHTAKDVERCAYLPPYSPELNPIEQFWHRMTKIKGWITVEWGDGYLCDN
ncbi:hypothetical protein PS15m_009995 [Mucor circinelloides]